MGLEISFNLVANDPIIHTYKMKPHQNSGELPWLAAALCVPEGTTETELGSLPDLHCRESSSLSSTSHSGKRPNLRVSGNLCIHSQLVGLNRRYLICT